MKRERFSRLKAFFSYTGILSLFYMNSKDSFVKFHARQGFALFISAVITAFVPLGVFVIWPFLFISAFTGAFKAYDMKRWKAPIIWKIPIFNKILKK
jgi:uncharacterized membrane protein